MSRFIIELEGTDEQAAEYVQSVIRDKGATVGGMQVVAHYRATGSYGPIPLINPVVAEVERMEREGLLVKGPDGRYRLAKVAT